MSTTKNDGLSIWYLVVAFLVTIIPLLFLLAPSDVQMGIHYKVVDLCNWWAKQYWLHAIIIANSLVSMGVWWYSMRNKKEATDSHRSNAEGYFMVSLGLTSVVLLNYFLAWSGL